RESGYFPDCNGAKQRRVVAVVTGAGFQRDQIAVLDLPPPPGGMRDTRTRTRCNKRIHSKIFGAGLDRRAHDGGGNVVLAYSAVRCGSPGAQAGMVCGGRFYDWLELMSRFDPPKRLDETRAVGDGAKFRNQPLIKRDRDKPGIAVESNAPALPAARLERGRNRESGIDVVIVAFNVGDKGIETRIHRFEPAQHVERLAGLRDAQ